MANIKAIERSPDPNAMRFVVDIALTQGESYCYQNSEDAGENKMAALLLSVDHIEQVNVAGCSVTVSQDGEVQWAPLLAQAAPFIREAKPLGMMDQQETSSNASSRSSIARELRSVIDPELGINIVDLGLVYNILQEGEKVTVEFTATTPGCPMRRYLQQHIEGALEGIEGISEYEAKLVWEPAWSIDMVDPKVELFGSSQPQPWVL